MATKKTQFDIYFSWESLRSTHSVPRRYISGYEAAHKCLSMERKPAGDILMQEILLHYSVKSS